VTGREGHVSALAFLTANPVSPVAVAQEPSLRLNDRREILVIIRSSRNGYWLPVFKAYRPNG
jgi:hypothetical protein